MASYSAIIKRATSALSGSIPIHENLFGLFIINVFLMQFQAHGQQPATFEAAMIDNGIERYFEGTADLASGTGWTLERSLDLSPPSGSARSWFPMATGYGNFIPPAYGPMVHSPFGSGTRQGFSVRLQDFPLIPIQPPISSVGRGPRPQFRFAHASMLYRESDGALLAQWRDLTTTGNLQVTAVFSSSEVDLSDPTPFGRMPFAAGCLAGPVTDPLPVYLSYCIFPLPANQSIPANPSALTGENALIRSFIVNQAAAIRADLWPPFSTEPPAPPSPVTMESRSFFRLRTGAGYPADINSNGIPDAVEAEFDDADPAERHLIISEACFFRTAAAETELIGGEAADWVEIWNPTTSNIYSRLFFE